CFRFDAREPCDLFCGNAAPDVVEPRPARDAVKVSVNTDGAELHKLVKRPLLRILYEAIDFKRPRREIDIGRPVRIEHGPFLGARLAWRNPIRATRVRADDDLLIVDLFGLTRIGCLVLRIFDQIVQKTHDLSWSLVFGLRSWQVKV